MMQIAFPIVYYFFIYYNQQFGYIMFIRKVSLFEKNIYYCFNTFLEKCLLV